MNNFVLPAEWSPQSAVILAWPDTHTDWCYMLDDVCRCVAKIILEISENQRVILITGRKKEDLSKYFEFNDNVTLIDIPYNDTWARDFGPIITKSNDKFSFLDFKFNGWGLKFAADKDNLVSSALFAKKHFNATYENHLGFVLEGGSIESDGDGNILTTTECLSSKNRNGNLSKDEINDKLTQVFNARNILWLNHGQLSGDDTDGHIDTLARFAPNRTILYVKSSAVQDPVDGPELELMEKELSEIAYTYDYKLVPLPATRPIFDEDGERIPATYANFLIINDKVLVPIYNQPDTDNQAIATIASAFPGRKTVGIDCNALIKQHGSLHCMTMQLPLNVI